jgi:hypothetical protein
MNPCPVAWSGIKLDTNHEIVNQNEFKNIYRATHAKIAKVKPTAPASFAFVARDTIFSSSVSSSEKFEYLSLEDLNTCGAVACLNCPFHQAGET